MRKRVVITGMGAITPIGNDVDSFWKNLCDGKSGIGRITRFDPEKYDTQIAAEVKDFDPQNYVDKKEIKRMDRYTQFAMLPKWQWNRRILIGAGRIHSVSVSFLVPASVAWKQWRSRL